jgi:hypothetical protein
MQRADHLLLDLGDVLTKGFILSEQRVRRFRFPSVTATRLLEVGQEDGSLLLDEHQSMPRLSDFDPKLFPRVRSYPGGERFLASLRSEGHLLHAARFVGSVAASYGADRRLLGCEPSVANVEAIVRKALTLLPKDCARVKAVLVIDQGAKADAIVRHCNQGPREVRVTRWSYLRSEREARRVTYEPRIIDAAECALAILPDGSGPEAIGAVMLVDVGYLRTKLAIVSSLGCEAQQELHGLGIADCVQRVLRDGQELGLIEDEVAVIRSFEQGWGGRVQVADRTFEVGAAFESARAALEQELAKSVQKMQMDWFSRHAQVCGGLAILGGGAAIVGSGLVARLEESLHFDAVWVAAAKSYGLVEGARRRLSHVDQLGG